LFEVLLKAMILMIERTEIGLIGLKEEPLQRMNFAIYRSKTEFAYKQVIRRN